MATKICAGITFAIVRHGRAGALAAALFAAIMVAWLAWPVFGLVAPIIGVIAGTILLVLAPSYVELVWLITEMLLPR
jgi:hypothetical protein